MATRLHLRSTTANVAGYVAGEKSTALPVGTLNDGSATVGGPFDLSTTGGTGSAQVATVNSLAQTTHQDTYLSKWISDVISSGDITAQTWTIKYTPTEGNANANVFLAASIYVLKSDDTVRGYIYDSDTALGTESPTSPLSQSVAVSGSAVSGVVGTDRIAFEVWGHAATQAMATAYAVQYWYDNTTTDSAESWIETPQALTFGGGGGPATDPTADVAHQSLFRRKVTIPGFSQFLSTERIIGGLEAGLTIASGTVPVSDVTLTPAVAAAAGAQSAPVLKADYLPAMGVATGAQTAPTLLATYLPAVNAATGSAPAPTLTATYQPAVGAATSAQSAPTLLATYLPAENDAVALAPVPVVDNQFVVVDPPLLFRSGFGVVGLSRFISSEQSLGGLEPSFTIGGTVVVVSGDVTLTPAVNAATAAGAVPVLQAAYLPAVGAATGAQSAPALFATYLPAVNADTGAAPVPVLAASYQPAVASASGAQTAPALLANYLPAANAATGVASVPVLSATYLPIVNAATAAAASPSLAAAYLPTANAATAAAPTPTLLATFLPSVNAATALAPLPVVDVQLIQVDPPLLFRSGFGIPGLSRFMSTELQLGGFVGGSSNAVNITPGAAIATGASDLPSLLANYQPVQGAATAAGAIPTLIAAFLASVNAATGTPQTPILSATYIPAMAAATGAGLVPSIRVLYLPAAAQASGAQPTPTILVTFPLQVAAATGAALIPVLNVSFLVQVNAATALALLPTILGLGFAAPPDTIRTLATGLVGLSGATGVTGRSGQGGVTGGTLAGAGGSRTRTTGNTGVTDV